MSNDGEAKASVHGLPPDHLTALLRYAGASVSSRTDGLTITAEVLRELRKESSAAHARRDVALALRRRLAQHAEQRRKRGGVATASGGRVRRYLDAVRPTERDALLLRHVGGLSVEEVAHACSIDAPSARLRLSKGLASLSAALGGREEPIALATAEQRAAMDRLSELVEGIAPDDVADLAAGDDALRDLVHEAERAVSELAALESDWAPDLQALDVESEALPSAAPAEAVHEAEAADEGPTADSAPAPEPSPRSRRSRERKEPEAETTADRPLWDRVGKRGRIGIAAGGAALLGAFVIAFSRGESDPSELAESAWSGKVAQISRAFGGSKGVERCSPEGSACSAVQKGDEIPAGSTLRTDGQSRVIVELRDGTRVSLDRGSELAFDGKYPRRARLDHGGLIADLPELGQSRARIDLPRGFIESGAGKLSIFADADRAEVEVVRGSARLVDERERGVGIHAGEDGILEAGGPPSVAPTATFGSSLRWSERAFDTRSDTDIVGLGELRAKKPGEDRERKGAVTLASHSTRVRIAGNFARTEIEEEFSNSADEVLEGIYRFPLPPDAQIERLALDVDGKWTEGAFVDRERAAAIWRGAIVNAGAKKPVQEEIVWVPGPWRDPALLEWQRGGRFELRIYPIPRRGARKVILAYTQVVAPAGATRRYTYPLPVDPSGSTRVGRFDLDVEVRGHDPKAGVRARGYDVQADKLPEGAEHLRMSTQAFVPSGDLVIEYQPSGADRTVTAWAYQPGPEEGTSADASSVDSSAPYAAVALRPRLPRTEAAVPRRFAIVVDSSRSMFGERYRRAVETATRMVGELDSASSVRVLACDSSCRALPDLGAPGAQAAGAVRSFLEQGAPEGGSDVTFAIRKAAEALGAPDGNGRIVYIGDGTPTIGAVSAALVRRDVEASVPEALGTVTTVAVGADADVGTLGTIAEAGGGAMIPYVPGATVSDVVYQVLGATYGDALSDVRIELPEGLVDVAPQRFGSLTTGREVIVTGRLTRPVVEGNVVLRGKLGSRPFEERTPIRIEATTSRGNAFVPRLWAAARIADLEKEPDLESRNRAVALSGKFHVASRHTSLLVLESAAMFRAFGLDRDERVAQWTGDSDASSTSSEEPEEDESAALGAGDMPQFAARPASGSGAARGDFQSARRATSSKTSTAPSKKAKAAMDDFSRAPAAEAAAAPAPAPAPTAAAPMMRKDDYALSMDEGGGPRGPLLVTPPPPPPQRRFIPMRKIWERHGSVVTPASTPSSASPDAIAAARREVEANELRREAVKKLFTLLFLSGDLEGAGAVAEKWSSKDPMDPDALTARADVAAGRGERDLAIRIMGSVVDIRPGDHKSQWRLARLHRWAGRGELGCRHSMAVAQIRSTDGKSLAEGVRCARDLGWTGVASDLEAGANDATRRAASSILAQRAEDPNALSGDLRLEATWDGGDDLDLAMVHGDGRVSWLGAPTKAVITARDVQSGGREALALRGAGAGDYVVEITRPSGHTGTIRGAVDISAAGDRRRVPFVLDGSRARIALVKIWAKSRLVPL